MSEYSDEYKRIKKKFEHWPQYKIDAYNQNIAISKHAKKISPAPFEKYFLGEFAYEEMVDGIAETIRRVSQDQFDYMKLKAKRLSETTTMSYQDALDMLYERWLKGDAE